ncbi:hypothetical protein QBC34DRAFT_400103 [Podospora aff. communis PSN243]|uniref:Uncharacterized protein n=1 Tax=Podospora aff. communis PSN243 TaxID=3040156 RepID=A0AAV9GTH1_9PEZI|nr:hypothetical protein QBC34DRAFT_400103 [Podospora aff. communis PSN243]
MRSIRVRGGLGGRGGFAGRGGRGGMFVNREGARVSAEDAAAGEGRFIKIENGRIWGPGRGAALAAGMGRGLRGRGRGGERKQDGDGKRRRRRGNEHEAKKEKMVLTPEEQKVMNDVEQGVVTDYAPKLTAKEILGYGPAVASDTAMAKIESAMEAMRMLGGARAFNSDAGVTGDTRETVKRYFHEKKPVFFNTPEEKAWMESSRPGWKIHGPQDATKKAILDSVVLGKYEKPGFAEARDTIPMIVNYHSSSTSYKTSDSAKFIKKLQELLPVDTTATAAPKEKTV